MGRVWNCFVLKALFIFLQNILWCWCTSLILSVVRYAPIPWHKCASRQPGTCHFIPFHSLVAPRIHFKWKSKSCHINRWGKGKGRQKCLQVANRKKKLGQQGFRKAANTFVNKQRLPWSNPHVCLCSDGAMWSSGLTNWESSAWVLSFLLQTYCSVLNGLGLNGLGQGFLIWEIGRFPSWEAQCL